MAILVCDRARLPFTSIELPPRKCRMRTPLANPCSLILMKWSALPCVQVPIMMPSSCHSARNLSHIIASRHTTQFSTISRIVRRSAISSVIVISRIRFKARESLHRSAQLQNLSQPFLPVCCGGYSPKCYEKMSALRPANLARRSREPPMATAAREKYGRSKAWYKQLWSYVFLAMIVGIVLGKFDPGLGVRMQPLGDAFIKLVRMLIAP